MVDLYSYSKAKYAQVGASIPQLFNSERQSNNLTLPIYFHSRHAVADRNAGEQDGSGLSCGARPDATTSSATVYSCIYAGRRQGDESVRLLRERRYWREERQGKARQRCVKVTKQQECRRDAY